MVDFEVSSHEAESVLQEVTRKHLEKAYGEVHDVSFENVALSEGVWTLKGRVVAGDCGGNHGMEPAPPRGEAPPARRCQFPFEAILDTRKNTIQIDRRYHGASQGFGFGGWGQPAQNRTPNDDRSDTLNSNNPASRAAAINRSNQLNPNNPAYRRSRGKK